MRDINHHVRGWLGEGRSVTLARVMAMDGFGGRRAGEALAVPADDPASAVGGIVSGAAAQEVDEVVAEVARTGRARVVSVPVGDADAVAAGLACGGVAHVVVQPVSSVPGLLWSTVASRHPVALATVTDGASAGSSVVVLDRSHVGSGVVLEGTLGTSEADHAVRDAGARLLHGARTTTEVIDTPSGRVFVEAVLPQPHALVLGNVDLARAIAAQGRLLGWETSIVDDRTRADADDAADRCRSLGPVDALVVLSHDLDASCRCLHAALTGTCGYVGALGSRHTQQARATFLRERLGAPEELISRIHGPVGLDLGARTPEETALAIHAEILAYRSGRAAVSLRATDGPING